MLELEQVLDEIPQLADGAREVSRLSGGLTNSNYKVVTTTGSYHVRRWSDDTGLLAIDRDNEYHNSVCAAQAGVGAGVLAYLPEHNTMVMEWLEGATLSAAKLRRGGRLLGEVAAACRRLHGAPRFRDDFDMFEIQPRYLEIVRSRGFRLPEGYERFEPHVAAIRDAFEIRDEGTVPCNNDLLAENFMLTPSGLRLIDYEYSGNNDACFELGNIWSESNLSLTQLERLVGAYYGRPARHKVARARLWGLMSKYGWTLWASIQDGVSAIDFDFWSWGLEKYGRAVAEFESPDFERLLDEARRID